MVLSKENGHVLGLVGLEHIKTMFFLFSVILTSRGLLGFCLGFLQSLMARTQRTQLFLFIFYLSQGGPSITSRSSVVTDETGR